VGDDRTPRQTDPGGQVPPGALSALLAELALAPEREGRTPAQDGFVPGAVVGRFDLLREIGRGGFGIVYEARDRELGRLVAFKAVRTGAGSPALREERLQREAEAAARLSHPNLVTLHDVGRSEAGPFLVLELLKGRTLSERLDHGPVPLAEALDIAVQVARGLAFAHASGVIHRDLKPANVFLCDGGLVKILDFGLAHAFGQRRAEGGTPAYMAPEQWRSAPEDERTDVFALGVMLYRMLVGEVPFPADPSGKALLSSRPLPRLEVPDAPGLGELATRMLSRDPVERPRDGAEVLATLEGIQEQVRVATQSRPPSSSGAPAARLRRSHPWRWAGLGVGLVAILAAGAFFLQREEPAPSRALVAVADVQNGTGDPELDGLSGLLVTALEQSRRIGVMTRGRMVEVARRAGHEKLEKIDEVVGRDIGRKAGATAVLVTNVHRLGSTYALEVRAIDPRRDAYIFTLRDQSPTKEGLLPLIDRVSDKVRREFQEPDVELAGRRSRLENVVTPNLDAYRHYFQARNHVDRIRLPEAVAELERALAIDPRFALAHYQLARLGNTGEISEARRKSHEEAALRLVDRLPERERGILLATSATAAGRLEEAETIYRGLAGDFPDDNDVLLGLGEILLDREQAAEAVPFLARAVELDPTNQLGHVCLSRALGFLGRGDELVAAARGALLAAPGAETELFLAESSLWAGDLPTATAASRRAISMGERQAIDTLLRAGLRAGDADAVRDAVSSGPSLGAAAAVFQGKVGKAREVLARTPPVTGAWAAQTALETLHLRLGMGSPADVRAAADALVATRSRATGAAAAAVTWSGEGGAAVRIAELLSPSSPDAALYRAVSLRRDGKPEAALPALQELARTHVSGSTFLDSLFLGEAALAAGRPQEAAKALRRFGQMNLPIYALAWAYPRGLLLLARAEEASGRLPEAREAAASLAGFWRDADPDFPPLREFAEVQSRLGR